MPSEVHSATVSKEPKDRRLFTKVKGNNASEEVGGLAFRVGPAWGGISWEKGEVEATADQALSALRPDGSRAPARAEAKDWLLDLLVKGPVAAEDVWSRAEADGLNKATLNAAKKELGVRSNKVGGKGEGWFWSLP